MNKVFLAALFVLCAATFAQVPVTQTTTTTSANVVTTTTEDFIGEAANTGEELNSETTVGAATEEGSTVDEEAFSEVGPGVSAEEGSTEAFHPIDVEVEVTISEGDLQLLL